MLPCPGSDREQLEAKIDLLEECVGSKYPKGLEIGLEMEDLDNLKVLSDIENNLSILPNHMTTSLHGPIKLERGFQDNFFQSQQGFESLVKTIQFARDIKAEPVNIHAHSYVSYQKLKILKRDGGIEAYRRKAIANVKLGLHRLKELFSPSPKICIENVPWCLTVDRVDDPQEALYELICVELSDFLEIVNPAQNIFATVDIDHLAQWRDSSQLLDDIKKLGRGLGHVHFSDVGDIWQPFISRVKEGIIPGDGRIGERVSKELLEYFVTFAERQELGIVLEVEEEDFSTPKNSRESLERTMKWLKELEGR